MHRAVLQETSALQLEMEALGATGTTGMLTLEVGSYVTGKRTKNERKCFKVI